jgi:ATP-dependent DNA helicase RecG
VGLRGDLDKIQKDLRGACKRIDPEYQPTVLPAEYMGRASLVIWAKAGEVRPYQVPEHGGKGAQRKYYIRIGSETVEAHGETLTQLLQLTGRVPFDDRRRTDVPLSAISALHVRRFLENVKSSLASIPDLPVDEVLRRLRLTAPQNGNEAPRNVALLFFSEDPDVYFPGARIEIAQFRDGAGGDLIETRTFRGPLPQQIRQTLDFLSSLTSELTRKVRGRAEADRFVAFPVEAMEEAIVNAVFHRGYDSPPEPTKVALYPDRLEITSFPGPVPGLRPEHLAPGGRPPQLPARTPRVGELLKSLRLAETWHTGVPTIRRKMKENGSPEPAFDFDEMGRTYFRVTLPAHPGYVVVHALREGAGLWHQGERDRAIRHLVEARKRVPASGSLAAQLIEYAASLGDMDLAGRVLTELEQEPLAVERHLPYLALARAHLDRGDKEQARMLLENRPVPEDVSGVVEVALLHKRSENFEEAHRLLSSVRGHIQNDPKALHELAQTKLKIAGRIRSGRPHDRDAKLRLDREAAEILRRVISLATGQPTRSAWAWFDLARTLAWLGEPEEEVLRACAKAIELLPTEPRFAEWLASRGA